MLLLRSLADSVIEMCFEVSNRKLMIKEIITSGKFYRSCSGFFSGLQNNQQQQKSISLQGWKLIIHRNQFLDIEL